MPGLEILTAALAVVTTYLGVRQWRDSRNKNRFDLYPKRVEIFRCTEEFLNRAWTGTDEDQEQLLAGFYHCKGK